MSHTFSYSPLLLTPADLKAMLPATANQLSFVKETRKSIEWILQGKDPRLLIILGPCSIHDCSAAMEYAEKLKKLIDETKESFLLVMRTYFEKPRTTLGWKGLLYDPHLDDSNDIASGLKKARELLLFLADSGIGAATEFLDPATPLFIGDLISWACIGARTAESQIHRQMASGLSMPVAFKNNTAGELSSAINGCIAASMPHTFLGYNESGQMSIVRSPGNGYGHIILRGGASGTNYHAHSIHHAAGMLEQAGLSARLLVDCSHGNSGKNMEKQTLIFDALIDDYLERNTALSGMLLESNLMAGNQPHDKNANKPHPAISLTDPCIDWQTTEDLLRLSADKILHHFASHALS